MREYRNAIMDNARWTGFVSRPDDIFVCTPSKCGTTWMQTIVANLLWPDGDIPGPIVNGIAPWIEAKFMPAEAMHAMLKAQTHRRAMKSHSPADAIPWFPDAKYITVARDGRDAFMSWCNHVQRMKMIDMMNAQAAEEGLAPMKKFDGDYHAYLQELARGEQLLRHRRKLLGKPRRPEPAVRALQRYEGRSRGGDAPRRQAPRHRDSRVEVARGRRSAARSRGCAKSTKRSAILQMAFEGGIKGFLFKGTNGRWRDVLTDEDVAAYHRRVAELLPSDAARWVEAGRHAVGIE